MEDLEHMCSKGPWSMDGAFLILEKWRPNLVMNRLHLNFLSIWVHRHGLPLEYQYPKLAERMGHMIGVFKKIDWEDRLPRNIKFMRVRVRLDPWMLVVSGLMLRLDDGTQTWIQCKLNDDRPEWLRWDAWNRGQIPDSIDSIIESLVTRVDKDRLRSDFGSSSSGSRIRRPNDSIKGRKVLLKTGEHCRADVFQQVLMDLQFSDLATSGQRFTWMNNREEDDFVMERLDRAFTSVDWANIYPLYSLRNLPIVKYDHDPIILDLELQTPFRKRPFKFVHMWITYSNCKDMVRQAWECNLLVQELNY
nr:hypothetical protein CFP56_14152 [Quercus suber]